MLAIARDGGFLDTIAAMFAAEWMYWTWSTEADRAAISDPLLKEWVRLHAEPEFEAQARWLKAVLDEAGETMDLAERKRLSAIFGRAQRLEIDFHEAAYSWRARAMTGNPVINGARLLERLDRFAEIGATAGGGVNRQALTELDRQARLLLAELAEARGFGVFQDPAANLFIRRPGRDEAATPLLIGSHLDSQPSGGRFDGALGTLSAFEVLESLEDAGVETGRPIEVVAWTNEEGCRFAPGCMGSSAFSAGEIPLAWSDLIATDGVRFDDELRATVASLPQAAMRALGFPAYAYLEVHIEQGPSLEKEDIPIGIVTGIQGTRWLEVTVSARPPMLGPPRSTIDEIRFAR